MLCNKKMFLSLKRSNKCGIFSSMKMIKIRFKDASDDARGALELAKHFRVICLPDDTYEVPEDAINILDKLNISPQILQTEGFDNALRTLRNLASA
jgi:hypothetical protein